ncbi:MAG TPA: HDOD domain-containing protein [Bryobacteraceae bacterium]|nr:HDOD domain-containing protein [Bryobacteraceae bacterium]
MRGTFLSTPGPTGREESKGGRILNKAKPDPPKSLSRREKLEACAERIAASEGVPPFCDHANEILIRTLDIEEGSSKKLVQVVMQDVGLAAQVLRLANSAMYNNSGRPILNVSHAIAVLGWLEVRSMASTVRYIEHFANRAPSLRELVAASVLTAVQAREVAAILGYPHPEEAYVCGLFRNLGELLIACHHPDEHTAIIMILAAENIPERAACLRVLDFFWDDVGRRVAALWQMPQAVRSSMEASLAAALPLERSRASITNYSHSLTRSLYRKGATLDTLHLETVLNPAGQPVVIAPRELYASVDLAFNETREMFAALQIPTEMLRITKQAERAREALNSSPPG